MTKSSKSITSLALSILWLFPFYISAKSVVEEKTPSCFDYYKFQSVNIDLHPDKQLYRVGEQIKFSGSLLNKNNYPLVGGMLVLRLSRLRPTKLTGPDIITEWKAKKNINLTAGEKQVVDLTYQTPSGLPTGTYILSSYFLINDKFNISGLSFTDDIYGGAVEFNVGGKGESALYFDRDGVEINGKNYRIFGLPADIFDEKTQAVDVSVPLTNDHNQLVSGKINYYLYAWDGVAEENLLRVWSEDFSLKSKETQKIQSFLDISSRPVYFLKMIVETPEESSEIHVRIIKSGFRPRLNDLGITSFPLKKGEKASIFACYHNTSENGLGKGNLILELKNDKGKIISQVNYEGEITGRIGVLAKDISNLGNFSKLSVSAKLYDNTNRLVDEEEIKYDCAAFSQSLCPKFKINWYVLGAGAGLAILALFLASRRKEPST